MTDKPSIFVSGQFPGFVHEYGPDLIKFLVAYYEFLEESGNAADLRMSIRDNLDIDRTQEAYIDYFADHFMPNMPRTVLADRRLVLKNIRQQLYKARGTERSYKFLFRILFDEDVEFYYPGQDILRASDGKWFIARSLTCTEIYIDSNDFDSYKARVIEGENSGALASLEYVITTIVSGITTYEIFLNVLKGTFIAGETVKDQEESTPLFKIAAYTIYPGKWLNTDSFLSSDKYLQDNFYYQEYSYVLKTAQPFATYQRVTSKLLHPAGTLAFGQFQSKSVLDTIVPKTQTGSLRLEFFPIAVTVTPTVISASNFDDANNNSTSGFLIENGFDVTISIDNIHFVYNAIDGDVAVANSEVIGDYDSFFVGNFGSWTIGDMISGKGFIGTSTTFLSDLSNDQPIRIDDIAGADPDSLNVVDTVDSDVTMRTKYVYTYGDLAQGKIYTGTSV